MVANTITLNSGKDIPSVGLGTYLNDGPRDTIVAAVVEAIKAGYRHIDTAMIYKNEEEVGEAVKKCIDEGIVKREDLFITTKLWNDSHHPEDVEYSCRQSLAKLGMDYVDLYLIHWPVAQPRVPRDEWVYCNDMVEDFHFKDTWVEMEKLLEKGLVKSIGVSNFNVGQLKELMEGAKVIPAVNQIESHLRLIREEVFEFCKEHNIIIEAYAPLGAPANPQNVESGCMTNETVLKIAEAHNKTPAHVCLRYLLQRGCVVLPKSVTPSRIQSNIQVFDFELSDEEMEELKKLNIGKACFLLESWFGSKFWPWERTSNNQNVEPEKAKAR